MHGGVEGVRLHDGDVAVLGDVVRHVDRVALRVCLVDVHHLQEESSTSQEEATMPTSPSGWSAARSTSSKLGGKATTPATKRKAKANLIMILVAILERAAIQRVMVFAGICKYQLIPTTGVEGGQQEMVLLQLRAQSQTPTDYFDDPMEQRRSDAPF